MRLLVKLRALKDQAYDLKYHHKLQGFIYSLLDGTPYVKLHDKKGYKFFCFSNIFPPKDVKNGLSYCPEGPARDIKKDEARYMLISSPEIGFIAIANERLEKILEERIPVNIGEMSFEVESVEAFEQKIGKSCTLVTGTPIILRVPEDKFNKYGIVPPKKYKYVFWRKEWPFEPFVKQLEENLLKKYCEFYGRPLDEFPIFEEFMFKKTVCNHVILKGREVKFLGSLWEFTFNYLDEKRREILKFGADTGFGEENSLGFGFMNQVLRRSLKPQKYPNVFHF